MTPESPTLRPLPISARHSQAVSLKGGRPVVIGRHADQCDLVLPEPAIALRHCEVGRRPDAPGMWIADLGSSTGTFVNRKAISAQALQAGDLIQVGSYAFAFNEADGFLVPVVGVAGAALHVEQLEVPGRVRIESLTIPAGQFLAITGPSGAGKTTLLKALAGVPELGGLGRIDADGHDIHAVGAWYRGILGYLPQEAVVHDALTPLEALRFIIRLRVQGGEAARPRQLLRELDLPESRWRVPIAELSGGEQKRVRIAGELVARPRILLLDEPASGLDPDREIGLMKLLRMLSMQGCTVVVVTHGGKHVGLCDRVLEVRDGAIHADSAPAPTAQDSAPPRKLPVPRRRCFFTPWLFLALREATLLRPRPTRLRTWPKLLVPVFIVPLVFALALHLTYAGRHKIETLGFFAVLASIWMGASLSLLAIVGERPIFDHEHFLYLRIGPYVLAKVFVFGVVAGCQATLFLWALWWLQPPPSDTALADVRLFFGMGWVNATLALLACAGAALGLFLSALARRTKEIANLLLPLVMIAQIVFSAEVCADRGALEQVYGGLHSHACNVWPKLPAERWIPEEGGWISLAASRAAREKFRDREDHKREAGQERELTRAEKNEILAALRAAGPDDDEPSTARRPHRLAAYISYLTLSRYGDIALRTFAYDADNWRAFDGNAPPESQNAARFDYPRWRREGWLTLAELPLVLCAMTMGLLWLQNGIARSAWKGRPTQPPPAQ